MNKTILLLSLTCVSLMISTMVHMKRNENNLKCIQYGYNVVNDRNIHEKLTTLLNDAVDIFDANTVSYSLVSGTLLHMYRDCKLYRDSTDVDISVPLDALNRELLGRFYDKGWKYSRSFGHEGQPGYEVAIIHPNGERMDLYGETHNEHFTWISVWIDRVAYMCAFETPTIFFVIT